MAISLPTNTQLLELAGGVRDLSDYIAGGRVARPRIIKDRIASLTHEWGTDGRISAGPWQPIYTAIVRGVNKGEIPQRERKRCEDLRDALEKTLDSLGLAFRGFDEPPSIRPGLLAQAQEALRGAADLLQRIAGKQAAATATTSAMGYEGEALVMKTMHPDWTVTKIAQTVGVKRQTLYTYPRFKRVLALLKAEKPTPTDRRRGRTGKRLPDTSHDTCADHSDGETLET